jgi:ligand-binding SRPBCC domain-containing protein
MRVYVETLLDCPPEKVWDTLRTSALLVEVIDPLLRFDPLPGESFPVRWEQGTTVRGRAYAFGLVPLGVHAIHYERIDDVAREIQTRESSRFVRRWDHTLRVRAAPDGRTLYSDEVEIEAGAWTLIVWAFAQFFYRHRQGRWRRIARRLRAHVPKTTGVGESAGAAS